MPHGRGYGAIPDAFREGERRFGVGEGVPDDLIVTLEQDLTPWFIKAPMDQGGFGSCTCHSVPAAWRYGRILRDLPDIEISRAQLYQDSGVKEGNTADVGRQIADVIQCMIDTGAAREELWPYSKILQGTPPPEVYADALNQRFISAARIVGDTPEKVRRALDVMMSMGAPIVIGIPVFKQFESDEAASTGIITMPGRFETPIAYHSMLLGKRGAKDRTLNSWGDWFGLPEQKGYCDFDPEYIPTLGQDMWGVIEDRGDPNV